MEEEKGFRNKSYRRRMILYPTGCTHKDVEASLSDVDDCLLCELRIKRSFDVPRKKTFLFICGAPCRKTLSAQISHVKTGKLRRCSPGRFVDERRSYDM